MRLVLGLLACTTLGGCLGLGLGRLQPSGQNDEAMVPVDEAEEVGGEDPRRAPGPPHPMAGCWDLQFVDERHGAVPELRRLEIQSLVGGLAGTLTDIDRLGEGHPVDLHDVSVAGKRIFFRTYARHSNGPNDPGTEVLDEVFEGELDGGQWRGRAQSVSHPHPRSFTGAACTGPSPTASLPAEPPPPPPPPPVEDPYAAPRPILGCWMLTLSVAGKPEPGAKVRLELRGAPGGATVGSVTFLPDDGHGYTRELEQVLAGPVTLSARTTSHGPMGDSQQRWEAALSGDKLVGTRTHELGIVEQFSGSRCR